VTGQRFIGVSLRSREVRAALNRLHWEVRYAIDNNQAADAFNGDLAEAVAIVRVILAEVGAVADQVSQEDPLSDVFGHRAEKFAADVNFFEGFHKDPR
jgi:hypothetical protein